MKKVLVIALAAVAMVACSNDETVNKIGGEQIAFDGAFIDAATRAAVDPSITTKTIAAFDVWGFMDKAEGVIFMDEDVTKSGSSWSYVNTQYWSPDHTYYFAALAPMNSENVTEDIASGDAAKYGLGTVGFTNVNGSEDLIYAATTVTTDKDITVRPDAVKFQFNHLLSKVKFTFKNGFTNENTKLVVKDIKMTAPQTGSINLAQADWWSTNEWELGEGEVTLAFGDVEKLAMGAAAECAQERLTIPANADQVYNVTFTVELYQGDVLAQTFNETTTVNGVALEIGKAYNFVAQLNGTYLELFPIEFDVVTVKEWDEDTKFQEEIVADNEKVTMVSNGVAAKTVEVKNGGTLDGAGNTLSIDAAAGPEFLKSETLRLINVANGGTIQNLTIDGNNASYEGYGIRGIFLTGEGTTNIDNVIVKNVTYTMNDDAAAKTVNVTNSTLEGWTSYNKATVVNFKNVSFECGTYATFRPQGETVLENCKFENGFEILLDLMQKKITFRNCTYNGAPLALANLTNQNAAATVVIE